MHKCVRTNTTVVTRTEDWKEMGGALVAKPRGIGGRRATTLLVNRVWTTFGPAGRSVSQPSTGEPSCRLWMGSTFKTRVSVGFFTSQAQSSAYQSAVLMCVKLSPGFAGFAGFGLLFNLFQWFEGTDGADHLECRLWKSPTCDTPTLANQESGIVPF